jgi:hypothetical protein
MKMRCSRTQMWHSTIALVLAMSSWPLTARAQSHADHTQASQEWTQEQRGNYDTLVRVVREATARFRNVVEAEKEDYHLLFGCVSGPDTGAMGLHYVNLPLAFDDELDPTRPEIVLYEQLPNGRLRLTGADFLVLKDAWDKKHPEGPPQLMGQLFHLFEAPNRFGLEAFYTLHVWAWKPNPAGAFSNWHTNVSCDTFNGQGQ